MTLSRPDMMTPHPALQPYARSITAGGLRLFYYDAGAGDETPMLLVHGRGDEADTWHRLLPPLARSRRVIAECGHNSQQERPEEVLKLLYDI